MKKALIMSDTHGLTKEVKHLLSLTSVERIFHCGDFCVAETSSPFDRMTLVKGNNDFQANVPDDRIVEWAGLRIFMTHGHRYQVNSSFLPLSYKAKEEKANVVLFGHTHYPLCTKQDGIIFVNPGSLKRPRGFTVPTFVLWSVQEKEEGKEGKALFFTFYNALKRQSIPSLSKTFRIPDDET